MFLVATQYETCLRFVGSLFIGTWKGDIAEIVGVFDNGRFGIRIIRNDQGLFLKPNNLEPTSLSPHHDEVSYLEEIGDTELSEKEIKVFCVMSRWLKLVHLLEAEEHIDSLCTFGRFRPDWGLLFGEKCRNIRIISKYWDGQSDEETYVQ